MSKILVILPAREESGYRSFFIHETYVQQLASHDIELVLLPPIVSDEVIDRAYQSCSGLFLIGGRDINPKQYGADKHDATEESDDRQDEVELKLTRQAIADKKPFLGICRGSQILAVALGGTLHQHIPQVIESESHGFTKYKELFNKNKEPAVVAAGSQLHTIIGRDEIKITCGHHQAVDSMPSDLRVSATSHEGIVEVTEHADPNYFCFGVQSHPEVDSCDTETCGDLNPLFAAFIKAVKAF